MSVIDPHSFKNLVYLCPIMLTMNGKLTKSMPTTYKAHFFFNFVQYIWKRMKFTDVRMLLILLYPDYKFYGISNENRFSHKKQMRKVRSSRKSTRTPENNGGLEIDVKKTDERVTQSTAVVTSTRQTLNKSNKNFFVRY